MLCALSAGINHLSSQVVTFVFTAVDADNSPQQVVVVLAECKSMSFHRWIPSAEEQGPELDCGWGPEELSDSIGQST